MKAKRHLSAVALVFAACSSGNEEDRAPPGSSAASARATQAPAAEARTATAPPATPRAVAPEALSVHGFPALRNLEGRTLANGDFAQWLEDGRLHMRMRYDFEDGRRIEERAVFAFDRGLRQERWSWREDRDGQPIRHFDVDLERGIVSGEKHEKGEISRWDEEVDVQPGHAFAGFGFSIALKIHRERLVGGEPVTLDAVVFTPDPRVVPVELSYAGIEEMRMAGRVLRGDRFDLEPQIPWIVDLFVHAPGTRVWLTHPPPAAFLRSEGPLLEPGDPVIRVDLLPGEGSGPAGPAASPSGG